MHNNDLVTKACSILSDNCVEENLAWWRLEARILGETKATVFVTDNKQLAADVNAFAEQRMVELGIETEREDTVIQPKEVGS